jgi:Phytanoyl-CoA dioxygenase (PhyH)
MQRGSFERGTGLSVSWLEQFRTNGWVRIPAAFSSTDAAAMCDAIWSGLARASIDREDPATWTKERPEHLQHLKQDPVFRAIGSARTTSAIDAALEGQPWEMPGDWGAFFLQFPTGSEWSVPSSGWHLDGNYTGRLTPPCGVMVHAMLTDVAPRCGGVNILSGSHRLVHKWFSEHVPPQGSRAAQLRRSLERHPYLRDLCTPGDTQARITRFHERVEEIDGIPLQVIENTATAGDVILMHSLLLHAAKPDAHLGTQPRFVLSKGFYERYW